MASPKDQALCPYGDPTCPCQDGDACHYEPIEGTDGLRHVSSFMNVRPEFVRAAKATLQAENAALQQRIERLEAALLQIVKSPLGSAPHLQRIASHVLADERDIPITPDFSRMGEKG